MSKKILLIEDDERTSALLHDYLKDIGYSHNQIIHHKTLQSIDVLEGEPLELILNSLSLTGACPGMLQHIRGLFPYVAVIVLASQHQSAEAICAIKHGAQDYLIKEELSKALLSKAIQYVLDRQQIAFDYLQLFQASPIPMYIYEQGTYSFLAVNDAILNRYGYSREEFLMMTALGIRPAEDMDFFNANNVNVPDTYYDIGRCRHLKKNGELFHVHIYAHSTEFNGKKAVVVVAKDIDKKVRLEEAFREKVFEVEHILESITNGFFSIDKDWRFTYINCTFERILKRTRQELIGKNVWDEFPTAIKLRFYPEYQKVMETGKSAHFVEFYDAEKIWLSVNAYPTNTGLAVFFLDITEERSLQQQIFMDRQNLTAIINNTRDIIWSLNKNYQIICANDAFWERVQKIAGVPVSYVGEDNFPKDLLVTWQQHIERAFNGETFKVVWEDVAPDGSATYEENCFNPIRNEAGEVMGISCISRDITEQKTYLQRIEQQNEKLREIARIQSHEVRRPVASILGLIQLFNTVDTADAINCEVLRNLKAAAQELDDVIRRIHVVAEGI